MSDASATTGPPRPHDPLVLWTDDSRRTGLACLPIFCEEDGCTCRVVRLIAVSIDERFEAMLVRGPGVIAIDYADGTRAMIGRDTRQVRATVDLDAGLVASDPEARGSYRNASVLRDLQKVVDDGVLDGLRARLRGFETERRRDEELAAAEAWQQRDWSGWDGEEIEWRDVRPDQPPGLYELDGRAYEAHEIYCADLECPCAEIEVAYVTREGDDMVGQVTVDGPSGQLVATRSAVGGHRLLMRLWDAFADRRDLGELERRRQRVLTIVPRIEAIQLRQLREAERVRRRVGRNDPCPCGSGKKHKRCCLI